MIGVSTGRLRAYLRAGVLSPEKGTRGELRFSFQDLLLLRKAEGLVSQRIPPHRVRRALKKLRERLTDAQPLTGVSLGTEGPQVVVHERGARWQAESGQVLLSFDRTPADGVGVASDPVSLPLSWTRTYGSGRVFYTALGHRTEVWNDPRFRAHLREAIRWALR